MGCPQIWAGVEEGCAALGEGRALPMAQAVCHMRFAKKGRLLCVQAA